MSSRFRYRRVLRTAFLLTAALTLSPASSYAQVAAETAEEAGEAEPASPEDVGADEALEDEPEFEPDTGVEEIVITGEATEGTTQAIPQAVTTFDQTELDTLGITDIESLALNTPSLHVGQFGNRAAITLRGIGIENIATAIGDPGVGFEVDGVHMGRPSSANAIFFDLQRVDVLRGPQATNGGRQTTGGRVAVRSAPPSGEMGFFGDFQYGSYDQILTRGSLDVPIFDEKLTARGSILYEQRTGFQEARFARGGSLAEGYELNSGSDEDNPDDANELAARFQLQSLLADQVDLRAVGTFSYQRGRGPAGKLLGLPANNLNNTYSTAAANGIDLESIFSVDCPNTDPVPLAGGTATIPSSKACTTDDPRETFEDLRREQDNEQKGVTAIAGWDLPYFSDSTWFSDLRLEGVAGWHRNDQNSFQDADGTNAPTALFERSSSAKQRSVEVFLERPDVESFDFKVGVYYFQEDVATDFCYDDNGAGLTSDIESDQDLENESLAGYGNVGYRLFHNFRLEAGIRYTTETKDATQTNRQFTRALFPGGGAKTGCGTYFMQIAGAVSGNKRGVRTDFSGGKSLPENQGDTWSRWNPSAGFEWEINDSSTLSFNYAEAFKAGGFALGLQPGIDAAFREPYDAEESSNFELTSKNEFFDNRVRFNLTLFWTKYDPFQICQLAGPVYFCESDGSATSRGIEIEWFATPVDGLDLNGHFNYLDARIDRFQIIDPTQRTPENGPILDPNPVDVSGNTLPKAPSWSGSVGIQYTHDMGRYGQLIPRAQTQFQARTYFRVFNLEEFSQDPFAKLDLRLTWQSEDGGLFAEAFVANVTDVDVINFEFVGSQLVGGPVFAAYQPPRTWGFRFGATF